jgi:hypothetical protein
MTHSSVLEPGGGLPALVNGGAPSASALRPSMKSSVEEPAKLLIEPGEHRRLGLGDHDLSMVCASFGVISRQPFQPQ